MKICKDGRIWGQNNKEASEHLGALAKGNSHSRIYIKKGYNINSAADAGKNHPFYGKKGKESANWKGGEVKIICKTCSNEFFVNPARKDTAKYCSRKCGAIWRMKHAKRKDTSIEFIMEMEFLKQGIPYMKQAPIEGIALVDFLLPDKVIVQCDGDFWHHSEWAKKQGIKDKDNNQDFILGFKGYTVYRFSGTEIRKSVRRCVNKIGR